MEYHCVHIRSTIGILPDDPDPTGDDRSASRECPGCGRIMSDREAREQRACNDCCEDGGP